MQLETAIASAARQVLLAGQSSDVKAATRQVLDSMASDRAGQHVTIDEKAIEVQLGGYGVLQPYLDDEDIEEVWINQPNELFFSKNGLTFRETIQLDEKQLQTFVHRMLRDSNRRVDRVSPFADSSLADGSRLHVVIPEITASNWAINLRKFRKSFRTLTQLESAGMLTADQHNFLREQVIAGRNLLIAGPTQAGKTTLLSALLNELPRQTRLVSCEETFEIKCDLPDWVAMQTRQPNIEGTGEIALRRLVKEALRMRPERLVIGEVREAESFDLLIAMNSGLPGLCTIHANSAQAALQKLATLPLLAGPNITPSFVTATIANSLDYVVQLGAIDGQRRLSEICRVALSGNDLIAEQVAL